MAVTSAAPKTKIASTFTINTAGGEPFVVHEHVRYATSKVGGVSREVLGRVFFKTEDGRGVIHNADDDTYSIPSLDIKSARRSA
jgi:hypothetical protein